MRVMLIAGLLLAGTAITPALAQSAPAVEGRVTKLEKEMRAVQRKVFPGANPDYFEPEIAPASPQAVPGMAATSPLADLNARVDALERSLSQLTGQVEQANFKNRQLEDAFAKYKADTDYRLSALEGGNPAAGGKPGGSGGYPPPGTPPFGSREPASSPQSAPPPPPPVAAATPPSPSTGDAAEDAYMAGYNLWAAKKYPEAETSLKAFVAKYPNHRRTSYAQNLLGRAYLDDGKPATAAEAFYANYKNNPRGERAPDSLYYLGQSLTQLKKTTEACKVYDELNDVYGAKLSPALKDRVTKARADAKCAS
ncbi:tetratricopeptide repeat protein [Flavisphingomonas formosensis]|uniref:tetratricopeptide repeat protein n=1 Tax=Flavisphingomonas formosensis TaxID=861534 RepID=UPI0012FB6062|nr:tetratricopeptide repeat protein [Sphingomonas formosensis]